MTGNNSAISTQGNDHQLMSDCDIRQPIRKAGGYRPFQEEKLSVIIISGETGFSSCIV